MEQLKTIDRYFWVFLCVAVLSGFAFPQLLMPFQGMVIYIVMTIVALLFLKVDILDIVKQIKKPFFLLYIAISNLVFIPLLTFFLFKNFISEEFSMGLLLLTSLPAGVSSAAFTDIMRGKTPLNLTIIIVTNLLATITIPFLFWLLFKTSLELDHFGLFLNLLKIFLIPFVIAKLIKRVFFKKLTVYIQDYYNSLIVVLLSFMIMISIAFQSEHILSNYSVHIKTIGVLFLVFLFLQIAGYFSVFWKKKGEKLAISNAKMIMNNVLGIVLALAFFPPHVLTLVILSLIPWNTMIILKHWYKKYLP